MQMRFRSKRKWYKTEDRKERVLSKSKSMKLTYSMEKEQDESKASVFRRFGAKLMPLQRKLEDRTSQDDTLQRDSLRTTIDILSI